MAAAVLRDYTCLAMYALLYTHLKVACIRHISSIRQLMLTPTGRLC